jgi:predicted dehydrogenase
LPGVFKTDVSDQRSQKFFIAGKIAGLDVISQHAAEHSAEILMPWERHERPRVRHHPDKARDQANKYGIDPKNIYNYENFEALKDNPAVDVIDDCLSAAL